MLQWLQGQASAIWVLHRWQNFKEESNDSCADFSQTGERIALVQGDVLQLFHLHAEQLTCRQTPLACLDWPAIGWSKAHGFATEQAVRVQQVLPGLPWLEAVRADNEAGHAPWTARHPVTYPAHDQAPWAWLGPRHTGAVVLEGFAFASAHHYAANHALQLRAVDPEHAHYTTRLALAANHCLQRSNEWAVRVGRARKVIARLAQLAPEREVRYWQTLAQAH